ncbi:MAG: hypothetical protein MUC88_04915 [Planctomycetes bacterium]|jgi:hypothetical protein|nr:hypothetical protein [Planctomycetota bacterium]
MRTRLALSLVLLPLVISTSLPAQSPPPAVQWVPPDAVICLHVARPKVLLDLVTGKEMMQALESSPFYRGLLSQPKFKEFLTGIRFLEAALGTDWRRGLARLTGGSITLAVCPQDTAVAIIDAEDAQLLAKLHETILNITRAEAEKQGRPEKVASKDYGGVTAWTFDGKEAHALIGSRLIFSSRAEGLKAVLDLRSSSGSTSLADDPAFRAARKMVNPQAAAHMFVNLKPLLGVPNIARLLENQRANPLAALLFAGVTESVRHSNWLSLELGVEGKTFVIRALADGQVAGANSVAAFTLPQKADDGAWPNLAVPGRIAALSLYRDLRGFYAAKDTLFPERSSGLIFFENMMGIFFTGRDLTTEVLAETGPQVRLVVAEPRYDGAAGTPQVQIPAFAAVLRLRHPEQFGKVVEEAWQKAVGLINFTRGQKALPGLVIDRPTYRDTKYTVAAFAPPDANEQAKLATRFNARPSLAMPGPYLILSSSDSLARDLIDALDRETKGSVTPLAQAHSVLEIDGGSVAAALQANRETLIQGDMLKKGRTHDQSAAGIDMLITLVQLAEQLKLSVGADGGLTQATLSVRWKAP